MRDQAPGWILWCCPSRKLGQGQPLSSGLWSLSLWSLTTLARWSWAKTAGHHINMKEPKPAFNTLRWRARISEERRKRLVYFIQLAFSVLGRRRSAIVFFRRAFRQLAATCLAAEFVEAYASVTESRSAEASCAWKLIDHQITAYMAVQKGGPSLLSGHSQGILKSLPGRSRVILR